MNTRHTVITRNRHNPGIYPFLILLFFYSLGLMGKPQTSPVDSTGFAGNNPVDTYHSKQQSLQHTLHNGTAQDDGSYIVTAPLQSAEELLTLLRHIASRSPLPDRDRENKPVIILLQGEEIGWFLRDTQATHLKLVRLAAELDMLGVLDFRVRSVDLYRRGLRETDLLPFVEAQSFPLRTSRASRSERHYL